MAKQLKIKKRRGTKKQNLYFGKGGHLAVMSELLLRGWNVAIPEVDVGDDIFVVRDKNGDLIKVQVKSSNVLRKNNDGSRVSQFNLRVSQLRKIGKAKLIYAFVVRYKNTWSDFILIDQEYLKGRFNKNKIGTASKGHLTLSLRIHGKKVLCKKENLDNFYGKWSEFPKITH
ncbi:MAG: hypothetical protein NT084_08590 [Bacteroidetes bacterium]|nr:hypothetical protein [Bacteroidota bacterium]